MELFAIILIALFATLVPYLFFKSDNRTSSEESKWVEGGEHQKCKDKIIAERMRRDAVSRFGNDVW